MGLSQLQERVARSFFALPESAGFALAGGAALVVQRLVDRTTRDLDFFGPEQLAARRAADALQAALVAGGLHCERVRDHATFVRLAVADGDQITEVDVCYDHQWRPSVPTTSARLALPRSWPSTSFWRSKVEPWLATSWTCTGYTRSTGSRP